MNPGSPLASLQSARKIESCENGVLCPPEDVEALVAAMAKMIEDEEYRESVRDKAIERSKYYSADNVFEKWDVLLHQVVNFK